MSAPQPTEVQAHGIGAPQAHWIDVAERAVTVSALPQYGGPDQPAVMIRIGDRARTFRPDQARELAACLLAASDWQPGASS